MAEPIELCTLCLKKSRTILSKPLSCEHLFCAFCSMKIRQSNISCPKCRQPIPVPRSQEAPVEDELYCVPKENDLQTKSTKSPDNQLLKRTCSSHKQETKFFCHTCKLAICSECLLTTHKIKEHDIASLVEVKVQMVYEMLKEMDNFEKQAKTLTKNIVDARELCQNDEDKLKDEMLATKEEAITIINSLSENLLDDIKQAKHVTTEIFSDVVRRHKEFVGDTEEVRTLCQKALEELKAAKPQETSTLAQITNKKCVIAKKYEQLKETNIPEDLNLRFEHQLSEMSLGGCVVVRPVKETTGYISLMESPILDVKEKIDIGIAEFDFASMVCLDDDWIVHVSNLYGSKIVTIKHYSLKQKGQSRKGLVIETDNYNCTLAKTAGHDRSILLASGEVVYRISFRQEKVDIKQTLKVSFDVEAITWDEYAVDCYLLEKNMRNVYWLSMNGDVNFLCAFQTNVQSASNMEINDQCVLRLLDATTRCIHTRHYAKVQSEMKIPLAQPLPQRWNCNEVSFTVNSMASMKHPESHFILFLQGVLMCVGHYDKNFRFLGWIVNEPAPLHQNFMDMAVKKDSLVLLFESSILVYKIPLKMRS